MCTITEITQGSNLLTNLPGAVVITNADGIIQFVNDKFCKITGYIEPELLGQKTSVLKSGHHDESFYKSMWNIILAGEEYTNDLINKRKDGSLYSSHLVIRPFRNYDKKGSPVENFIAISTDVSYMKRMEDKWKAIINGLPNIIVVIFDENRRCIELYPEGIEKKYVGLRNLFGNKMESIDFEPENIEKHNRLLDKVENDGGTYEETFYSAIPLEDGSIKDSVHDATCSRYNHTKYIVVLRDVTESKTSKLRSALIDSVDQLKKVDTVYDEGRN